MNVLLTLVLFLYLVLVLSKDSCQISRCGEHGPDIRFPFHLNGQQHLHCGYPGFELSCIRNITKIWIPSSGLFWVTSIDYTQEDIYIYDPDVCLPKRLLNLNLSSTPFRLGTSFRQLRDPKYEKDYVCPSYNQPQYHYDYDYMSSLHKCLQNYSLLNCSTSDPGMWDADSSIPCLSVKGNTVVATPSSTHFTSWPSCVMFRMIQLPSRYRTETNYSISLNWDIPTCRDCEERRGKCRLKNSTSNETACFNLPPPFSSEYPPEGHSDNYEPAIIGHSHNYKAVIIGVSIATSLLLLAVVTALTFFGVKRMERKDEKENRFKIEKFLMDHKSYVPTRYSYADIREMTNQFKKKLGQGGFGSVFRGKLPNEVPVAIKVLANTKGNGEDFTNEVGTIGMIHHVNVVRLLGFCAEGSTRALIYEFMSNNSLAKFISSADSANPFLGWAKLHNISIGIAKGIEYLHQGCNQRILHLDIKPQNVLLDHNFNPKISDFGLSKLCAKDESLATMTAARGTIGYIAPEVFAGNFGHVSHKSDVYSFGMLVLEMVGARNISNAKSRTSQVYLPEWIYSRLIQGQGLDLKVDNEEDAKIAQKLLIIAYWCVQWYPVNRPSMKGVVRMLEGDFESLVMPPNPFASTANTESNEVQPNDHIKEELL